MDTKMENIQEIIDNLMKVCLAIAEFSKIMEKETDLTGPQICALKILAKNAPLRVSDLARRMYPRPAMVVGILDRLEAKGLVTRSRSNEDRRVVNVDLSALGKEVLARGLDDVQMRLMKGFAALPNEQFSIVDKGIQEISRILGTEHLTQQSPLLRNGQEKYNKSRCI